MHKHAPRVLIEGDHKALVLGKGKWRAEFPLHVRKEPSTKALSIGALDPGDVVIELDRYSTFGFGTRAEGIWIRHVLGWSITEKVCLCDPDRQYLTICPADP